MRNSVIEEVDINTIRIMRCTDRHYCRECL